MTRALRIILGLRTNLYVCVFCYNNSQLKIQVLALIVYVRTSLDWILLIQVQVIEPYKKKRQR